MSTFQFPYNQSARGLRKVAARSDCRLTKTDDGWLVYDANYGSLVAEGLNSTEVLNLFSSCNA